MSVYTEADAKKRWCPFARVVTYDKHADEFSAGVTVGMTAANKTSGGEIRVGAYCLGSGCMAWRWREFNLSDPDWPHGDFGWCGLAGQP